MHNGWSRLCERECDMQPERTQRIRHGVWNSGTNEMLKSRHSQKSESRIRFCVFYGRVALNTSRTLLPSFFWSKVTLPFIPIRLDPLITQAQDYSSTGGSAFCLVLIQVKSHMGVITEDLGESHPYTHKHKNLFKVTHKPELQTPRRGSAVYNLSSLR